MSEGVGENDLWPSDGIGLEVGDSVMTSPGRNAFLESLEGAWSRSVDVDGVRERGR